MNILKSIFVLALLCLLPGGWVGQGQIVFAAMAQQRGTSESLQNALDLIREGQVSAAIDLLRRLGEQGNGEAFFHLAEIHRLGVGRDPAPKIALMYYRLGAQLGNKQAALNLANILYFEGSGSEAELNEALAIWQQYALFGDAEAAYLLGMIYWNGDSVGVPDPVRGYGLVWLAAQAGYAPAEETEQAMVAQLNPDALAAAKDYAENLETKGFDKKPLDLELVTDEVPDLPKVADGPQKPADWDTVWRLEVGFAMGEKDTQDLEKEILAKKQDAIGDLVHEVIEAPNRPGLYRLLFGPVGGMQDAVRRCVSLKRAGYDCFAKPPR